MITILLLGSVVATSALFEEFATDNANNCTISEFACHNGQCISHQLRCNEKNDCEDASDENGCDLYLCQEPKYFRCKNKRCISKSFVCDGENDCDDFSDEVKCESFKFSDHVNSTCEKGHWQCSDKLCIPEEWVCNGQSDCLDGSDEIIGCSAKIECDGFKCNNGHCIPNEWRCDGHFDCKDNSDEEDCENHTAIEKCTLDERKYMCRNNHTCIDLREVCDGKPDCPDKSDENILCKSQVCATHGCSHDCAQLPTGPKCLCPTGYHNIDEKHCKEINECDIYGICDQKCRNTAGSFECYCDNKYVLQEDKKTCKADGGEAVMIFSTKSQIRTYTLQSQRYFPVATHLEQVVGVYYNGHHIYWTDVWTQHESIVRSAEDGSHMEVLVSTGLELPEDLAVDYLTGNIYFTDGEVQHIGVCKHDGSLCTVLVNKDVQKPRAIVLNVEDGDMFWTDWGKPAKISYSSMDGSNHKPFVSDNIHWPNGLALDYPNQRLYWTDARKMILENIRLDGTDRRTILQNEVMHPYAIAVFENRLYWSDWTTHSIQSCDKFTGKNHSTIIKESKEYIYGLSIFHPSLYVRKNNPCTRALCSDICLINGKDYSCACPQNKELAYDKHTCREKEKNQMLVVASKTVVLQVEHQTLGNHLYKPLAITADNIGCLTFNSINNTIMISDLDTRKILTYNLNTGISHELDISNLGKIIAMDYDPMGNNLYMCDEKKEVLEMVNLNTMSRKILLHDMQGEVPQSIALVPEEGIMFVALRKENFESHIDRFNMDGTDRRHIIDYNLIGPISLYYERDMHRIFFTDAGSGAIESINTDGYNKIGFRSYLVNPIGITSLKKDIFWLKKYSRSLFWTEKNATGYNRKITLDIPSNVELLHLISITPKKQYYSPCHVDNGHCSHICLMSHKTMFCDCPIGWKLSEDNHTCTERQHCDSTEFLCVHSNTCILKSLRCNGHKDCIFGEDEEECESVNKCSADLFQCKNGDCIKQDLVCNHDYDCRDKSDEFDCENRQLCPRFHFKCGDECIAETSLCDGISDCKDGSDEENCDLSSCENTQFRCDSGSCIPKSWECDHEYDCADLSDEHSQCSFITCSSTMFTCSNGKCLDKRLVCDDTDDCGDNSDEMTCEINNEDNCGIHEFACSSNKSICVLNSAKCNGTSECPHHEDEKDCSNCNIEEFSCDNKKCIPAQWLCDGTDDCGDNTDEKAEFCNHDNKTSFTFTRISHCNDGFRCRSGNCIDLKSVCDGKHDCYDGDDEDGLCSVACAMQKHPCSQKCISTPVGPVCKCKPGFELLGDGHTCQDINECQIDPPICSQLCKNIETGYICDCFNGYQLRSNKKSCKGEGLPMKVIFTSGNQIRLINQKGNSLSILYSEEMPKISGLDAVLNPDHIYFTVETTGTIHRIDPGTQIRQYIEHTGQPQKISVDWSTNNVYFYNADSQQKSISVCNFDEKICAKLINIDAHRYVSALAVDSVNSVLFYSVTSWWVFNSPSYVIYKTNLDGSGRHELVKTSLGYITGLTFDFNKKFLYYANQQSNEISMVTYEGKMDPPLFRNLTRPINLKFFEDHLYYLTSSGYVFKCQLYDIRLCGSIKVHSRSSDFFTIIQESLQPKLENACINHTCTDLCIPSKPQYKCLCRDGTVISSSQSCPKLHNNSEKDDLIFNVQSVHVTNDGLTDEKKGNTGVIVVSILVPILILILSVTVLLVIRRRNNGKLNISVKYYNPVYNAGEDEKPILQPDSTRGFVNPIHFSEGASKLATNIVPQNINQHDI